MSYQSPKLEEVSMQVSKSDFSSGKETASCCSGSCCYGYDSSDCSYLFG